jgi:RNase P subunit RPR2
MFLERKKLLEKIDYLFSLAEKAKSPDLEKHYIRQAWKLATKTRVRLGKRKRLFCRKCFHLFGAKDKRRKLKNHFLIVCSECGTQKRIFISRK